LRIVVKPRQRHPEVNRAPWRFLEDGDHGIAVQGKQVVFTYPPGVLPAIYSPGHGADRPISVLRNLASIKEDLAKLPIVAATLGPLHVEQFESGYTEPLADWKAAAVAASKVADLDTLDTLEELSDLLTDELLEHGGLIVPHDLPDFVYNFHDLIGAAMFEASLDLFSMIEGKPRRYRECTVCTRWILMRRRDQMQCSQACTAKAHRDRK
jgi:hypothetical protein